MKETILLGLVAAVAAAGVVAVAVAKDNVGTGGARPPRINLAVFEKPQRPVDRLPAAFADSSVGRHFRNSNSRLLGTYHRTTWYAVPGRHHTICLAGIAHRPSIAKTFGPCSDGGLLANRAIWFAHATGRDWSGPDYEIAGIANDGFTRVRWNGHARRVRRNAFFLTVPKDKPIVLRLTGPGMPTNRVPLRHMPIPLNGR